MKFRKKIIIIIICLSFININILAGLYYTDYLDNPRYKIEFNTNKQLFFNAFDISATKMDNDPQIINSLPSIFVVDNIANRVIWNNYVNNKQGVDNFYNLENGQTGFRSPRGICSFSNGDVFLADTINDRIVKLHWNNSSLVYVTEKRGNYIYSLYKPFDICVDRYENIYCLSYNKFNQKVLKLNKYLDYTGTIGEGILLSPKNITAGLWGYIFVNDANNKIIKFNIETGEELNCVIISSISELPSNSSFNAMDCDIFDNLYVVDPVNNKLYKFNPDLEYIDTYSGGPGMTFTDLRSVTVDKIYNYQGTPGRVASYGMVFTLEKQRVQYFDIGMDIVRVKPIKDTFSAENEEEAEIEYVLTEPGYQTIKVMNEDGSYIKTLINNEYIGMAGKRRVKWDGKDVNGNMVLEGDYIIEITAHDLYNGGKGNVTKTQLCPVTVYTPPKIWSLTAEPNVITPEQNITIKYLMSKKSFVYMDVVNANGDIVKKLLDGVEAIGGIKHIVIWDGKDSNNIEVPEGEYIIKVKAKQEGYAFGKEKTVKVYNIKNPPIVSINYNGTSYLGIKANIIGSIQGVGLALYAVEFESKDNPGQWVPIISRDISASIENKILAIWDTTQTGYPVSNDTTYKIRVRAENIAGMVGEDVKVVYVDNIAPQINTTITNKYFSPISAGTGSSKNSVIAQYSLSEAPVNLTIFVESIVSEDIHIKDFITPTSPIIWNGTNNAGITMEDGYYYIVFKATDKAGNETKLKELTIIDTNRYRDVLVKDAYFLPVNWNVLTPDWYGEDKIIYTSDETVEYNLAYTYIKTGLSYWPIDEFDGSDDSFPHITNDNQVVFVRNLWNIYMRDIDGLPNFFRASSYGPVWTKIFDNIAYTKWDGINVQIRKWNRQNNSEGLIYTDGETTTVMSTYPGTNKILYEKDNNLYTVDFDGTNQKFLVANAVQGDVSPDGKRIVYKNTSDWNLYVCYADGTDAFRLTTDRDSHYPRWSPSGTKIVYNYAVNSDSKKAKILELIISDKMNLQSIITNPTSGQTISGKIEIKGTATDLNFDYYDLKYGSGANPTSWQNIAVNQTIAKVEETLAVWDTTNIPNGQYTIKLTSYDKAGNYKESSVIVTINNTGLISNLTINPKYFRPLSPYIESTNISFTSGTGVTSEVWIFSNGERTVQYYTNNNSITWDGRNLNGYFERDGIYKVRVKAKYGSQEQILEDSVIIDNNQYIKDLIISNGQRPSWSPTDIRVVYDRDNGIYISPIDGSTWYSLITSDTVELKDATWGIHNKIAYKYGNQKIEIRAEGGELLGQIAGDYMVPEWSNSGEYLAYADNTYIIYSKGDGTEQKIVKGHNENLSKISWGQNDLYLVYSQKYLNIDKVLCWVTLDGKLMKFYSLMDAPSINKATGELAFIRDGNIYIADSTFTKIKQITTEGEYNNPAWSNKGDKIACDKNNCIRILDIKNWEYPNLTAEIIEPANNSYIKSDLISIKGIASDMNFKYYYLEYCEQGTENWIRLTENITTRVINEELGMLDTRNLKDNTIYKIRLTVEDLANNILSKTISLWVDKTSPESTITMISPFYESGNEIYMKLGGKIKITATDTLSDIKNITVNINGTVEVYPTNSQEITFNTVGQKIIQYYATDLADNKEAVRTCIINIINEKPVAKIIYDGPYYYNPDTNNKYINKFTQIMINGISSGGYNIPIEHKEYKIGDGIWQNYTGAINITDTISNITISGKVFDILGSESDIVTDNLIIDNEPPVTIISHIGDGYYIDSEGDTIISSTKAGYILTATDEKSGVLNIEYKKSGENENWLIYKQDTLLPIWFSNEGLNTLYYRTTDMLGNKEVVKSLSFIVDNTKPVTKLFINNQEIIDDSIILSETSAILSFVAEDPVNIPGVKNSGVKKIFYNINNGEFIEYQIPVILNTKNDSIIKYYSVDNVNNIEAEKTLVIIYQTPTITLTVTPTFTLSLTITPTETPTYTITATITDTITPTDTATKTATDTITQTMTPTETHTATSTETLTMTDTETATLTQTPTDTIAQTDTVTATPTKTITETDTLTATETATETATSTMTVTRTVTNTITLTNTCTLTVTKTITLTLTATKTSTKTQTATPTYTSTATATSTFTATLTRTATKTFTRTKTPIKTFTSTITPTRTMTPVPVALILEFKAGDVYRYSASPHPQFRIKNRGAGSLNIAKLEIRYWYKYDGTVKPEESYIDWAGVNGNPITDKVNIGIITGLFGTQDRYLKITFKSDVGNLGNGINDYLEVNTRFNKQDWSQYDQANDWSFVNYTSFTQWNKVTVYYDGVLVYGQGPGMSPSYISKTQEAEEIAEANVFCYPNPAKEKVIIRFSMNKQEAVKIEIKDMKGGIIWQKEITGTEVRKGINNIEWDLADNRGNKVSNGVYIYKIIADSKIIIKKLTVVR